MQNHMRDTLSETDSPLLKPSKIDNVKLYTHSKTDIPRGIDVNSHFPQKIQLIETGKTIVE